MTLDYYKILIDRLVSQREDVHARRVREGGPWPETESQQEVKDLISELSPKQREALAAMLQNSRDSGIHDVLAVLSEEMNLSGLEFVRNGQVLPNEPFGTELFYDWISRVEGDDWPESG